MLTEESEIYILVFPSSQTISIEGAETVYLLHKAVQEEGLDVSFRFHQVSSPSRTHQSVTWVILDGSDCNIDTFNEIIAMLSLSKL